MENVHRVAFDMCEMEHRGGAVGSDLRLVPFEADCYEQYRALIDGCFCEMRKALDIRPHAHYCDSLEELMKRKDCIFLLWAGDALIGTVSCFDNEIESVAVSANHQRQGYGRKLVEFALAHMQARGDSPIKLCVAKWNKNAIALYESLGFELTKETTVEGVSTQDPDGNWMFEFTATGGLSVR